MHLYGVSARAAEEVRALLSIPEPAMSDTDRKTALHTLLQLLARDIAGRDVRDEECENVLSAGLGAFEQLCAAFEGEQLGAHEARLRPQGPPPG